MSNERISLDEKYRDFTLEDTQGEMISLSDFEGQKNIYLVFNRGFM
jgi:peroxiredoxin